MFRPMDVIHWRTTAQRSYTFRKVCTCWYDPHCPSFVIDKCSLYIVKHSTPYKDMNILTTTLQNLNLLPHNTTQHIPITLFNFPLSQIHYVPLIYMAYLTTRPNTQNLRLLILPILLVLVAYTGICYKWEYPGLDSLNWLFGELHNRSYLYTYLI